MLKEILQCKGLMSFLYYVNSAQMLFMLSNCTCPSVLHLQLLLFWFATFSYWAYTKKVMFKS